MAKMVVMLCGGLKCVPYGVQKHRVGVVLADEQAGGGGALVTWRKWTSQGHWVGHQPQRSPTAHHTPISPSPLRAGYCASIANPPMPHISKGRS